jgi:hypothetical protein
MGLFDDNNGIFLEYSSGTAKIVKRSYTSGSPSDSSVVQTSWNIDQMNGSTKSKFNLDFSKLQIFVVDLQWLGSGTVRCGFMLDGALYYVHKFHHANINSTTYMTTASLPIRYQISSTSGSGKLKQICSTVISEGGYEPDGNIFNASNGITLKTVNNTEVPILSIRLSSSYPRVTAIPVNIAAIITTNHNVVFRTRLYQGVTSTPLTSESFNSANTNSAVQYDIASTAINTTNSIIVYTTYSSNDVQQILEKIDNLRTHFLLTSNINGNSDYICITGQNIVGQDASVSCALTWHEYN